MKTSRYLKIIGVLEIITLVIYLIVYVILAIINRANFFLTIVEFAALAFFGPAFGIALITLSELLEDTEQLKNKLSNEYKEICDIKDKINPIENKQIYTFADSNKSTNNVKPTNVESLPNSNDIQDEMTVKKNLVRKYNYEYYEQLKKDYSKDEETFNKLINQRYELLMKVHNRSKK